MVLESTGHLATPPDRVSALSDGLTSAPKRPSCKSSLARRFALMGDGSQTPRHGDAVIPHVLLCLWNNVMLSKFVLADGSAPLQAKTRRSYAEIINLVEESEQQESDAGQQSQV